ncbi:transcriptional regulator [Lactiplantibacillus paraplantarum]|uniref:Transcriptional regulator n=1 Tax=Lactiplantibacillus paraplantarum TaxID=60520 RepID=A0ABQ0NFG6_9LACO|nr:transcriptional regulator [Lactiplantibacillus paraplantarum]
MMDKTIKNYLEQVLRDYPRTDKYIENRMKQLSYFNHNYKTHSTNNEDKNTMITMIAININTDRRLTQLELNRTAIDYCLGEIARIIRTLIRTSSVPRRPLMVYANSSILMAWCSFSN